MNINELNRIKVVNIEERTADAVRGSGTFAEILDNVYAGVIIPLVDNSGNIVGMSFDTKTTDVIEDSILQRKFEIRYSGKNVMSWVLKSLKLKADGRVVSTVFDDEEGIRVIVDNGECIVIETRYIAEDDDYEDEEDDEEDFDDYDEERGGTICSNPKELPTNLTISYYDIFDADGHGKYSDTAEGVKAYLRDTYNHYLSGKYGDPKIEFDDEEEEIVVTGINWGRKR